jgi:putative membrane protein
MKTLETPARALTLVCMAALAAGCSAPQDPGARSGTTTATLRTSGLQDPQFVTAAAGNGRYEVQASRLAMVRAASPQVRNYAQMLVDHHTLANNELMELVRARGMRLPGSLPRDKHAKLDRLASASASGGEFDRMYIRLVGIEDHEADIALFERASRELRDPELRAWAGKTLPTLRSHLDAARSLTSPAR